MEEVSINYCAAENGRGQTLEGQEGKAGGGHALLWGATPQ